MSPGGNSHLRSAAGPSKASSPALLLNDVSIDFCDSAKYLGIVIDNKLRFDTHVNKVVTKASQRMHIIRTFLYQSTKPLASMLFKSFIISVLTYCLPILYTSVYAKDKRDLRKIFNDGSRLGLFNIDTLDRQPDG